MEAPENINRWNFDADDEGLLLCKGDHDKSDQCEEHQERLSPHEALKIINALRTDALKTEQLQKENTELKAQLQHGNEQITLSALALREAAYWANPDITADEDETEVCIMWIQKGGSTEGETMESGYYLYYTDCPEEGVIGPLGSDPVPNDVRAKAQIQQRVPESVIAAAKGAIDFVNAGLVKEHPATAASHIKGLARLVLATAPQPPEAVQSVAEIKTEIRFLLERVFSFEECLDDDTYSEWNGHVMPSIARLRLFVEAPQGQREGE